MLPAENGIPVVGAYAPPLRASIPPEGLKRTSAANPVYPVRAPFESATTALNGDTDGVASKVAVKVPVCEAIAVFCHTPPEVAVTQVPLTLRATLVVCVMPPLVPVTVKA